VNYGVRKRAKVWVVLKLRRWQIYLLLASRLIRINKAAACDKKGSSRRDKNMNERAHTEFREFSRANRARYWPRRDKWLSFCTFGDSQRGKECELNMKTKDITVKKTQNAWCDVTAVLFLKSFCAVIVI